MNTFQFLAMESSGTVLHGLRSGTVPSCAIHIHGTWGNFYENPFALQLSDTYQRTGWSYASVNNIGHDGGSIEEDFEESLPEIADWVNYLSPGNEPIILQGHSLGALKILRLLQDSQYTELQARIHAVVLLSPFDIVAFNGGVGEELQERRAKAEKLKAEQGGKALVTADIFDVWPLSVSTYLQATSAGGRWDLVPTREKSVGVLRSLKVPTFIAIGGSDFAAYPDPRAVAELIAQHAPMISLTFIEGAPHNFAGHEDTLANAIGDFVQALPAN